MAERQPRQDRPQGRTAHERSVRLEQQRAQWAEERRHIAERAKQRIAEYVATFFSVDESVIDQTSEHAVIEQYGTESHTVSVGFSEKKSVKPWDASAYDEYVNAQWDWRERLKEDRAFMDASHRTWLQKYIHDPMHSPEQVKEVHQIRTEMYKLRINEDVVGAGDGWHVLCDGVGGRDKHVARMMSEAVRIATEETLNVVRQYDTVLNEDEIVDAIQSIPDTACQLKGCVQDNEMAMRCMVQEQFDWRDCCTTMDVMYYSPHHSKTFVMHTGDSRTYAVVPGQPPQVRQLTIDHEERGKHPPQVTELVSLSRNRIHTDMIVLQSPPGTRFVTLSDGCFSAHEEVHPQQPFEQILQRYAVWPQKQMVHGVQEYCQKLQRAALYFDDASAVSTMVP